MGPWLLLDATFLCHRNYHALNLGWQGMLLGFFRDVLMFQDQFATDRIVFCFDHGGAGMRGELCPGYKSSREARHAALPAQERQDMAVARHHVVRLWRHYLPACGFCNVLVHRGYEADDLLARCSECLEETDDEAVIISSDADLLQLLRPGLVCYNPHGDGTTTTHTSFQKKWGIAPPLWANVKALAGCATDDVPGIKGVGEKSAAAYYAGTLAQGHYRTLIEENLDVHNRNIGIVRLPFKGTPTWTPRPDKVTWKKWDYAMRRLGMRSMIQRPPGRLLSMEDT